MITWHRRDPSEHIPVDDHLKTHKYSSRFAFIGSARQASFSVSTYFSGMEMNSVAIELPNLVDLMPTQEHFDMAVNTWGQLYGKTIRTAFYDSLIKTLSYSSSSGILNEEFQFLLWAEQNGAIPEGSFIVASAVTLNNIQTPISLNKKINDRVFQNYPVLALMASERLSDQTDLACLACADKFMIQAFMTDDVKLTKGTPDDLRRILTVRSRNTSQSHKCSLLTTGLFVSDNPIINSGIITAHTPSNTPLLDWAITRVLDPSFKADPPIPDYPAVNNLYIGDSVWTINDWVFFIHMEGNDHIDPIQIDYETALICSQIPPAVSDKFDAIIAKKLKFTNLFKG